jgi:serine phosphatase RsbU (regulator of sigma subunit)
MPRLLRICCLTFLLLGLLAGAGQAVWAQAPLALKPGKAQHLAGLKSEVWVDSSATATLEEAQRQAYRPAPSQLLFFGINHNAYWIRLRVRNEALPDNDWVLLLDFPILDSVDIYHLSANGQLLEHFPLGFCLPPKNKPLDFNAFAVPLDLPDADEHVYYLRLKSRKSKMAPLSVVRDRSFQEMRGFRDMGYGFFFGILAIMVLYNLTIYWSLQEKSYLYYSLTTASILLTYMSNSGYAPHYIWPNSPWVNQYILIWLSCTSALFSAFFTQDFLKTRARTPRLHQWLKVIAWSSALAIPLAVPYTFFVGHFMYYVLILEIVAMITAGVIVWRMGYREAVFYVIGWGGYILGALLLMLRNLGLLSGDYLLANSGNVGAVWQVVMLALALSARYARLRQEREDAVRERLEMEAEAKRMLEYKVEERTAELMETNEELGMTVEELNVTNERLSEINNQLSQRNRSITSSINYAQRIQAALLPQPYSIAQAFPEHFILFKPRDIVSGDFYWFDTVGSKAILVVADCTGHGVPGAFMSLLGNDAISHAVVRLGLVSPEEILQYIDAEIYGKLQQGTSSNQDGMDAAVLVFDFEVGLLEFSGAKRPLLLFHQGERHLFRGDKHSIAGKMPNHDKVFAKQTLQLQGPAEVYLFSDGYHDQFGGPIGAKFSTRRFYDLLENVHALDLPQQQRRLSDALDNWMGKNNRQIDDILVFGARLSRTNP